MLNSAPSFTHLEYLRQFSVSALIFLLLTAATNSVLAKQNVVDYYNEIQAIKTFSLGYKLFANGDTWTTKGEGGEEFDYVSLIDIRNGYLLISDEGTGGGNFDTEVVLFRKTDKSPLILVTETGFDPPFPYDHEYRAFTKINGKWKDVTPGVYPNISPGDYFPRKMNDADFNTIDQLRANIIYKLPRKGTQLKAYLVINTDRAHAVCQGDDFIIVDDKKPYLHYCNNLEGKIHNQIIMKWDKPNTKFLVTDKIWSDLPWGNPPSGD